MTVSRGYRNVIINEHVTIIIIDVTTQTEDKVIFFGFFHEKRVALFSVHPYEYIVLGTTVKY